MIENTPFKNVEAKSTLTFDYEINFTKFDDSNQLNSKLYYYDKSIKMYSKVLVLILEIVNYNLFTDCRLDDANDGQDSQSSGVGSIYKANFLKRLVSKKKKRLQNEFFDLDLSYNIKFIPDI